MFRIYLEFFCNGDRVLTHDRYQGTSSENIKPGPWHDSCLQEKVESSY